MNTPIEQYAEKLARVAREIDQRITDEEVKHCVSVFRGLARGYEHDAVEVALCYEMTITLAFGS